MAAPSGPGIPTSGNTGDADVEHWAEAVAAVAARFPHAERVIPGHGSAGGRELLDHTIQLARAHNSAHFDWPVDDPRTPNQVIGATPDGAAR